ncbi:MAG TPA: class I SAM-dependent methyltransferase [Stellaceae bacterium]|nr:class I SAM-dependent methyltransferase [Stellaceae bacterium]
MSDAAQLMDRMYRRQRHIYDLSRKFYLLGRDEAIAGLHAGPGVSVLEIGCGTGRNLVKLARAYPGAHLFGLDVSREMLASAAAAMARAGLSARVALGQGDATAFDSAALFGRARFDRVMISYALSMIPPWREALKRALEVLAPGGSLHLVDFGPGAGLPGPFRTGLRRWLAAFDVTPRDGLGAALEALSAERGLTCKIETRFRGYAVLAVARPPSPRSGEGGP